ncbi:LOB domain-containing protein 29-like [Diospyros lotus]|uniref:LOB domain-containing protein 29-like n=1 Tax=Diospyros lotus TaxID=55363 RepID=UPI00225C27B6|nr:LOB domain-containing protein 29-like [Diospyros lotus]
MPRFDPFRCSACTVLRRQCTPLCILVPYFCHEKGSTYFAAIHRIFDSRNASILLAHLPVSDRLGAAITLLFEAQALLQDPVYGCVSHILALQQHVSDLQAYQALLQDSLFVHYFADSQPVPQPDTNPNWSPDLSIILENASLPSFLDATSLPYPDDTSSSQMSLRDDIDELRPVVFSNHRRH